MDEQKVYSYEPTFQKTTLPNGVRVVSESHPGLRAASAGLFVDVGTRDEPEHLVGATHFVEHLVFKGTHKRTALEIAESLEVVGGELNAYTTRELTCFHTHSLKEDLPLALDVLCDLVTNATFDPEEFEKERQVILQEIDMSKDDLEEYILDLFFEKAFKGHPLARWITGTKASLRPITRDQLYAYYKTNYCGSRLVLAVAGSVNHDEVVKVAEKLLGHLPKGEEMQRRPRKGIEAFSELIPRPSEQVHLLYGLPSTTFVNEDRFDAYVFNALIGGGVTSRLYQKVREKGGLVYSIYSYLQTFVEHGLLMIYAGASEKTYTEVAHLIQAELKKLGEERPRAEEVEGFKRQIKGQILLGADDMENRMNSIGINEYVFGEYRSVDRVIQEINQVSVDSVAAYIDKYVRGKTPSLLMMGDLPTASFGQEN
jgi:predicted Zn-dependent peptidase